MRLCNEKQNEAMCAVVEDTLDDASRNDGDGLWSRRREKGRLQIFWHVSEKPIDGWRIRDIITKIISNAVWTDENFYSIAKKLANSCSDSQLVMSVIVERLQRQGDCVVGRAVEHVKYHTAMVRKYWDDLPKIGSRKASNRTVGDPYETLSSDQYRSHRRYKRDKKGTKL